MAEANQSISKEKQKPTNVSDSDIAWYTKIETCLTPLPEVAGEEEVASRQLEKWPKRLVAIPPRISRGTVDGVTEEVFQKDLENILDMNAFLGGFAVNFVNDPVWVINIVPVEAKVNTVGAIYERGLIRTY
uniref:Methyltransferase n=1 Tax=Solanum lycopersicum TaxID=4081 RepID=K4C4V1_SOLLC